MRTHGDCQHCPLALAKEQASVMHLPPVNECIGILVVPAPLPSSSMNLMVEALNKLEIDPSKIAVISQVACPSVSRGMKPDVDASEACKPKFEEELAHFLKVTPVSLPVLCFGQEAAEAVGLRDKLSKTRGFSYWQGGRRYVATWHPNYVVTHPETYLDLLEDLMNVFVYPVNCPVNTDVVTDAPVDFPWAGAVKAAARKLEQREQKTGQAPTADELESLGWHVPEVIASPLDPIVSYQIIDTAAQMQQLMNETATLLQARRKVTYCIDLETTGFDQFRERILCVAIGTGENTAYVVSSQGLEQPEVTDMLRRLLTLKGVEWVLHNAKFDCRFLLADPSIGTSPIVTHDTMLMHYVLDERIGTHGLKMLARRRLGLPEYESAVHALLPKAASSYKYVPSRVLHMYAAQDVCYTLRLLARLEVELECHPLTEGLTNVYELLVRAVNAFIEIESEGIHMDLGAIDEAEKVFSLELAEHLKTLRHLVNDPTFNPRSAAQVAHYMYDVLKFPEVQLFRNHKPRATSREALDKLLAKMPGHPFLVELVKYRELSKILSTYVVKMRGKTFGGRLHTDFKLHGTVTGRLSAANPNVQNIPRPTKNPYAARIRNFFTASPGWTMIGADYKSAELRVATLYSHERFWRDAFDRGVDVHSEMCKVLFGPDFTKEHRMIAKMMVFGLLYGRGATSIAVERGWPKSQAQDVMRRFFKNVPNADRWLKETRALAISQGYLTTPVGRVRRFGLVNEANLGSVSSQAVNFPISSFASDCCLLAFLDMHDWFKSDEGKGKGRCLMVIHDAIYIEAPVAHEAEVSAMLTNCMRGSMPQLINDDFVSLDVDLHAGHRWGEL